MRALIYIMTPVLILTVFLAARFVTWDTVRGVNRQALAHLTEGTLALRAWKFPQAIEAFTQAIDIEPRYAEAYVKRGLAYYRAGQYKAAISDYTQTLALKRYHADAHSSRGDAYRALGKAQHAIADYAASLKKRWSADVLQKRAQTYLELHSTQNAIADYTTVIKRQPSAIAYYNRGNAYLQLFNSQESPENRNTLELVLADLDKAIALEPRFVQAYISRAQTQTRLGEQASEKSDYIHAVELLTEAIQHWQGELHVLIQAYYWRAFAYQKLGEGDKARNDVNAANERIFKFLLKKFKICDIL